MKIRRVILLLLIIAWILFVFMVAKNVYAAAPVEGKHFENPEIIRCTCYVEHGYQASGQWTRENTAAGPREWLGYTAALYEVNEDGTMGDFIGYFEFTDTGAGLDTDGDGKGDTIKNGESIDVWQTDMAHAKEWIRTHGDYVYMKIIKGEG